MDLNLTPAQHRELLEFTRAAIRRELGDAVTLPCLSDSAFSIQAGCFVSLHRRDTHRLRGCIGLIRAEAPLRDSLAEMAVAAVHDGRFRDNPVTLAELPDLDLELSILSPFEPASTPLDFDLQLHGIYLTFRGRAGLFLPQVARETGWSREMLLQRLCAEKMGLPADAWRQPDARLSRFQVYIVGPEPFVADRSGETPAAGA